MSKFGEDFGQKVDLTASIRSILRNYPEGTAIFKELIQNADDAGARTVRFCLDRREHGREKLADSALAQFQGPSLLVFNDAVFSKEDFQSIQRIGDSLKNQAEGASTKIGRFGIGFNAVYHWTDLPAFISDHFLVMLDPQARFLPNVSASNPGKIVDWLTNKGLLTEFADQFAPFEIPEMNWSAPLKGTLFRLPLRSPDQAETSLLSKRPVSLDQVEEVLQSLIAESSSMLLFLRHVENLAIQEWRPDQREPTTLFSCSIVNSDSTLREKRSFNAVLGKDRAKAIASQAIVMHDFRLLIRTHDFRSAVQSTEHWDVRTQFGGGNATRLAANPHNSHLKFVPLGGVAALLPPSPEQEGPPILHRGGWAYCFLPLPISTGLPVMVNGFFELSSNRRDIWQENVDMTGDGSARGQWNIALMEAIIAPCFCRLLVDLRDHFQFSLFYQQLWPKWNLPAPWSRVGNTVLQSLTTQKLLLIDEVSEGSRRPKMWIEPCHAVVFPLSVKQDDRRNLFLLFRYLEVAIVDLTSPTLHSSLIESSISRNIATPSFLREILRRPAGPRLSHDMCKMALQYSLSDHLSTIVSSELNGLQILPLKSGTVGTLRVISERQKAAVDSLVEAGFTQQDAMGALATTNYDANRACEVLTASNSSAASWRAGSLFIVPNAQDDLSIFQAAACMLVNPQALEIKELEHIASVSFQNASNIRAFDVTLIPDILVHILPQACLEKRTVDMKSLPAAEQDAVKDFLPKFWLYVNLNPKALQSLVEGLAVLPVNGFEQVCPISRLANSICPVRGDAVLTAEITDTLRQLGVGVLDCETMKCDFASFPSLFWKYIHPPSFQGVISSIVHSFRELQGKLVENMQRLPSESKDRLRSFLADNFIGELAGDQREVLVRLPIFRAVNASVHDGERFVSIAAQRAPIAVQSSTEVPSVLFPTNFISHSTKKELELMRCLGVRIISKVEYYSEFLLPHASFLHGQHPEALNQALLHLFIEFRHFVQEKKSLVDVVKSSPCLPNGSGELTMIGKLFDSSEEEILSLMGESLLPHPDFRSEDVLVVLRGLGLRTTMDLSAILECARSIALMDDVGTGEAKLAKSRSLLHYLDRNLAKFLGADQQQKSQSQRQGSSLSIFSNLKTFFTSKQVSTEAVDRFKEELRSIAWLPVLVEPPLPYLPWFSRSDAIALPSPSSPGEPAQPQALGLCAAPMICTHVQNMWFCSASRRIVDVAILCPVLRELLGWDLEIPVRLLAIQLRELSAAMQRLKRQQQQQQQQAAAAAATTTATATADSSGLYHLRQAIADHIAHFYSRFNQATETELKEVFGILESAPWIWIGSDFVRSSKTALHSAVNAAPFLHQLPAQIRSLDRLVETFQIKRQFLARDYVDALCEMAKDSGANTAEVQSNASISVLPDTLLDIAISLVVVLSGEATATLKSYTIYVPDTNGRLYPATELVNDDVPWLAGQEFLAVRANCRMVHPKISSAVAEKIGVSSLRMMLVKRNMEENLFGVASKGGNIESFGQAESLTNRLKTILDLYPDGSPILYELIQNADDSKAATVRIMVDENYYRSESLMDPRMEALQGPALVVQNDAKFTDADFRNLASVGQGSKLEKLATTGRFGLGFNSTYHISDTPMILSGEYFVYFDPHCAFVPGATMNQPGMKIKYTSSDLNRVFAHQFEPFLFHGFEFSKPYSGTMFRFPLRTVNQAKRSEICKRSYQLADLYSMIDQIASQLPEVLLFLRSVKKIEIYKCVAGSTEPILLHTAVAKIVSQEEFNDQGLLQAFDPVKGLAISKDDFYAKLRNAPNDKLPWSRCSKQISAHSYVDSVPSAETGPSAQAGPKAALRVGTVDYEIVSGLCGGNAKMLACQQEARHLKLVPYGSIAVRWKSSVASNSSSNVLSEEEYLPPLSGQLFCFLPLPIKTSLPVHLNAYWELTSNRRDIWRGEDTQGEAKLRSDWNMCVMKDVLSTLYARLLNRVLSLTRAQPELCNSSTILSMLPCPVPPHPWDTISEAVFPHLGDTPFLRTKLGGGRQVSPRLSYFLPEQVKAQQKADPSGRIQSSDQWLEEVLLDEGVSVVLVSAELMQCFAKAGTLGGLINPSFIRQHFSESSSKAHPCLQQAAELSAERLARAAKLLLYATEDIAPDSSFGRLHGVKLLPLSNGNIGVIRDTIDGETYFLSSDLECSLLGDRCSVLVASRSILGHDLLRLLESESFASKCNVRKIQPIDVLKILRSTVPAKILAADVAAVARPNSFTNDWLKQLWTFILDRHVIDLFSGALPILPIQSPASLQGGSAELGLVKVAASIPVLRSLSVLNDQDFVLQAFQSINIFVLDEATLSPFIHNEDFTQLFIPSSRDGLLKALDVSVASGAAAQARNWSNECKLAMHKFVLDSILHKAASLDKSQIKMLRMLPIWLKHGANDSMLADPTTLVFEALDDADILLPPNDIPARVLSARFLVVRDKSDRAAYERIDVRASSKSAFTIEHIIPSIESGAFSPDTLRWVGSFVLGNLAGLANEHPDITKKLENCAMFTANGASEMFVPAVALYDPDTPLLPAFLPPFLFPCEEICSNSVHLAAMKKLGLRKKVSCPDVLRAVSDINSCYQKYWEATSRQDTSSELLSSVSGILERSQALMRYLEANIESLLESCDSEGLLRFRERTDPAANHELVSTDLGESAGGAWAMKLRSIGWVAVLETTPLQFHQTGLPWPARTHASQLAAPVQCAQSRNIWLCSSTTRISALDISNPILLHVLGWDKPISGRLIALQLIAMHDEWAAHSRNLVNTAQANDKLRQTYDENFMRIFGKLYDAFRIESENERTLWINLLAGKPVIWLSSGKFVETSRTAMEELPNISTEPFLHTIPQNMHRFRDMLLRIGVKETFTSMELTTLTREYASVHGDRPLDENELETFVGIVKLLFDMIYKPQKSSSEEPSPVVLDESALAGQLAIVHLPDSRGVVMPAASLVYNDAPWISTSFGSRSGAIHLVHSSVSNTIAQGLGAKSRRVLLFSGQSMVCPPLSDIIMAISGQSLFQPLNSIVQLADNLGCRKMDVIFDQRSFRTESLLHPGLAAAQGPSLVAILHNVVISPERISRLMARSAGDQFNVWPTVSCSLLPCFLITDCLQILSGGELVLLDPCGEYLGENEKRDAESTQGAAARENHDSSMDSMISKAKVYCIERRDQSSLLESFAHQFEPFLLLPSDDCASLAARKSVSSVVIRMPLRSKSSFLSPQVINEEMVRVMFGNMKTRLCGALLFGKSIEKIQTSHIPKDSNTQLVDAALELLSNPRERSSRLSLLDATGWEKHGVLSIFSSLGSKKFVPLEQSGTVRLSYTLSTNVWIDLDPSSKLILESLLEQNQMPPSTLAASRNNGIESKDENGVDDGSSDRTQSCPFVVLQETWETSYIMGHSSLKGLALDDLLREAKLKPFVGIAMQNLEPWHLARHDVPPEFGLAMMGAGVFCPTGLPFLVEGQFIHEIPRASKKEMYEICRKWNVSLIASALDYLYPRILSSMIKRVCAVASRQNASRCSIEHILEGLYKYWLFLPRLRPISQSAFLSAEKLHKYLSEECLFLNHANAFQPMKTVTLNKNGISNDLLRYLRQSMPIAKCPKQVATDLEALALIPSTLSSGSLRASLKKDANIHVERLAAMLSQPSTTQQGHLLLLELFKISLDDLLFLGNEGEFALRRAYRNLLGCPLLLMADNTVRLIPSVPKDLLAVVSNECFFQVLPQSVFDRVVHPTLLRHVPLLNDAIFQDTLGIVPFGPAFINDLLPSVLPAEWKGLKAVEWSSMQSSIELLLYTLWKYSLGAERWDGLTRVTDFAVMPCVSRDRRILLSLSLLPFVLTSIPTRKADEHRKQLRKALSNAPKPSWPEYAAERGNSKAWEWASCAATIDFGIAVPPAPKRETEAEAASRVSASLPEESNVQPGLIPAATASAPAAGAAAGNGGSRGGDAARGRLVEGSGGDDDESAEARARNGEGNESDRLVQRPADATLSILSKAGFPFVDSSILEGNPSAMVNDLLSHLQAPVGKRLVEIAYNFALRNIALGNENTHEPLISFSNLTVAERNHLLVEAYRARESSGNATDLIEKLKALSLFTSISGDAPVSLADCQRSGVYWCEDRTVLDIIRMSSMSEQNESSRLALNGTFVGSVDASRTLRTAAPAAANEAPPPLPRPHHQQSHPHAPHPPQPSSPSNEPNPVLLANHSSLREVYRWLQISELTAPIAMVKFVVPTIGRMNSEMRLQLLQHLASKWAVYGEDSSLVNALQEVPLVASWDTASPEAWRSTVFSAQECNTLFRKISSLVSWTNNELLEALQGPAIANYCAPPALCVAENHAMFSALGMQQRLSADTLVQIVMDIEKDAQLAKKMTAEKSSDGRASLQECCDRGRRITRYILSNDNALDMLRSNPTLLRKLNSIKFLPMSVPKSVEEGGHVTYEDDIGAYSQFVSRAKGALAFTVMPILDDDLTPPMILFSSLGIVSQPPEAIVLRHLKLLIRCNVLDRWNVRYSISDTFVALFSYLQDNWTKLEHSIKQSLLTSTFIPIGHALVAPNRVFFRLTEDLSPFMYELPRQFGAQEALLKQLRVRESPTADDYTQFLQELNRETGTNPLNPNELRAIHTIAQTIITQLDQANLLPIPPTNSMMLSTAEKVRQLSAEDQKKLVALRQRIHAPDENSVMRNLSVCVINDDSSLYNKLGETQHDFKYFLLHPWLRSTFGTRLLLLKLSEVVAERVDKRAGCTVLAPNDEAWQSMCSEKLSRPDVHQFLQQIVHSSAVRRDYSEDFSAASEVPSVADILGRLTFRFCCTLRTICVMCDPFLSKDIRILSNGQQEEALEFVDKSDPTTGPVLYVNTSKCSSTISIDLLLAKGLCELLGIPKHNLFAISQFLANSAQMPFDQLLGLSSKTAGQLLDQRGLPGTAVSALDLSLIELRPFRTFRQGEIVAIEDGRSSSAQPDSEKRLVYGKVVEIGDSNASGLRRLDIRTKNGVVRLLSTEVYAFRSARHDTATAQPVAALVSKPTSAPTSLYSTPTTPAPPGGSVSTAAVRTSQVLESPASVGDTEVLDAVEGLLRRVGMPLSLDKQALMKKVLELEAAQKAAEDQLQQERQNAIQLRQRMEQESQVYQCSICLENKIQCALTPCGHSFCAFCCDRLPNNRCPTCRTHIRGKMNLFIGETSST